RLCAPVVHNIAILCPCLVQYFFPSRSAGLCLLVKAVQYFLFFRFGGKGYDHPYNGGNKHYGGQGGPGGKYTCYSGAVYFFIAEEVVSQRREGQYQAGNGRSKHYGNFAPCVDTPPEPTEYIYQSGSGTEHQQNVKQLFRIGEQ